MSGKADFQPKSAVLLVRKHLKLICRVCIQEGQERKKTADLSPLLTVYQVQLIPNTIMKQAR